MHAIAADAAAPLAQPGAGGTPKVAVRRLAKRFGATVASDSIDLDIRPGEFLTLLGASGCGKTTLMRLIAGFEQPDAGSIAIDGRDVTALPPRERKLGMVFQQYSLFPHMSVAENIAYGLRAQRAEPASIGERVTEMLQLVQLPEVRDRRPSQLSGGQQQRIALARALATRPTLLMLDEPLGALDLKLRRQLQAELKRIHGETGTTFLFVTHDQEEALFLSDRIGVMRSGRIEQLADPETIYLRPANPFVADFIGEVSFLPATYDAAGGRVRFEDGTELALQLPRGDGRLQLAVRPEQARPVAPGAPNSLTGRLVEVAHESGTTSLHLELATGARLKCKVLGVERGLAAVGDAVAVSLQPGVIAFDPP